MSNEEQNGFFAKPVLYAAFSAITLDVEGSNIEVRKETYFYNGRSYHYITDKRKLKGLENYLKSNKNGN
jgi:hypothetical protein